MRCASFLTDDNIQAASGQIMNIIIIKGPNKRVALLISDPLLAV